MIEVSERIRILILKRMQGELSEAEALELQTLTHKHPALQELVSRFSDEERFDTLLKEYAGQRSAVKSDLDNRYPVPSLRPVRRRWAYAAIAASVALLIGSGIYFIYYASTPPTGAPTQGGVSIATILPASEKATLTLANNTTIDLTQAATGEVATEGKIAINKTGSGVLTYSHEKGIPVTGMNMLRTPRGGYFRVQLSDGTTVWLNAASSLSYPAVFSDKERVVTLTGEGYFEVAKDKNRPFYVNMDGGMQVEVVGTKFNCNSYQDDIRTYTTLLEGKVNISIAGAAHIPSLTLMPGQQAEKGREGTQVQVKQVDAALAISWVKGSFYFDRVPLPAVFRELERWYDVQFDYDPSLVKEAGNFKGSFERSIPISDVLAKLEFVSTLRFTMNGNKVQVLKP